MTGSIVVDPDDLAALAAGISSVTAAFQRQTALAEQHAIADPTVAAALASVTHDWSRARDRISSYLDAVSGALRTASDAYRDTDGAVRRAATPPSTDIRRR